jgi:putative phosphoribosyl transferase
MLSRTAVEVNQVRVPAGCVFLEGDLKLPDAASGLVMFAHGSGSGRHSPRNRLVAEALNARGLGTLLLDLLTHEEEQVDEQSRHLRFDIPMLARRLAFASDWLSEYTPTRSLPLGIFGASTGAGAALIVAAQRRQLVRAVVSRGGRPDLAGEALPHVECPTLFIVGGFDVPVIELNREAMAHMRGDTRLVVVPGATHLFEESGKLEEVGALAGKWFSKHLRESAAAESAHARMGR